MDYRPYGLTLNTHISMTLHAPFEITPRLMPGLRIADSETTAWLAYDTSKGQFVIDLPDGTSEWIDDYRPGLSASRDLVPQFGDILSFLGACAESRSHAERRGKDPMDGENSSLFSPRVGEWAQRLSDEIDTLRFEIEETTETLIEP